MTPEIVNALAQFMQRVQLNAQEIPAWQACMQALGELAQEQAEKEGGSVVPPPESE